MTRIESIRTKTWVTNDGRHMPVAEMSKAHLQNTRRMLQRRLVVVQDQETAEYLTAWIDLIGEELTRRVGAAAR